MTIEPVDYERFVAMAERILTRWGQVGTLSRPKTTGPSHNPVPATPETCAALFAVLSYRTDQIDGTRIRQSDKLIYVSPRATINGVVTPLGFAPAVTDNLIEAGGGLPFKIIDVEIIKPASTPVLYVLQARR